MKKILTLIALVAFVCTGAMADQLNLSNGVKNNGTMKNVAGANSTGLGCTWTSGTTPVVTIKSKKSGELANVMNKGNGYIIADAITDFEISLPDGYLIESFTFNIKLNDAKRVETFTSNDGAVSLSDVPSNAAANITVSNIKKQSASFTLSATWKATEDGHTAGDAAGWSTNTVNSITIVYSIDYTSKVNAEIKPWVENGIGTGYFYLNATDPNVEALQNAYNTHTGETWSEDEYNNLTTLLNAAIKMPETGYYRIKNKVRSNPYIGFGTETSWNKVGLVGCSEDAAIKDASTLIKLEKSGATYTLSTQGRYVAGQSSNSATFPTTTDESAAETFTIAPQVPGYAAFVSSNNGDGKGSLHHAGWGGTSGIVRWEAAADASQWALEEATELGNGEFALQIALNEVDGKYYATTCLPFPVSLSEEAYKVTLDGKKAIEEPIGSDIPAGTPVLLMSETSPTLTATILNADPDDVDCGALKGVLIKTAVTDLEGETPVVLAAPNGKIGFFKLAEGASLSANRAYIAYEEGSSATPGSSKAFFENGFELGGSEVTGVEAIDNGQLTIDNSAVFNLQGQRVNKAQKGVYIQNGKKVVLK